VALALGRLALLAVLLLAFGIGDLASVAAIIGLRAVLMLPVRLAAARMAVPFDAARVGLRLALQVPPSSQVPPCWPFA
jgi:hypothetical protein